MIQTVTFDKFQDAFKNYNRTENFSPEGLRALYDYLEEVYENSGEPLKLDVIALCCEYTEYKNFEELQLDYSDISSMDKLENNTTVIKIDDTDRFIIQDY